MNNGEKKTFLISAYACEPGEGSEPGVGWNWVIELAKRHNVIVITRSNNKRKIEEYIRKRNPNNIVFYYCDVPKNLTFWKRGQRGVHLYYSIWQIICYKLAKRLIQQYMIDYAMTVTFGNIWMPTFMHWLPCKFVWGPIGGGEGVPNPLLPSMTKKQYVIELIRKVNRLIPLTNPWKNNICKKSELILVRTLDTLTCIPQKYYDKCELMIETGISKEDIEYFRKIRPISDEYQNDFIICGRMYALKLFSLAIDAFAAATEIHSCSRLHIVGDGPDKEKMMATVKKYGLEDRIIFEGKLSREKTLQLMASVKGLLITSAKEGGSWVMFEAMLLKKPIICFDSSGMRVVVDREMGYMIPVCTYQEAVERFKQALIDCCRQDTAKMGAHAYQRVTEQFTWKAKVDAMLSRLSMNTQRN